MKLWEYKNDDLFEVDVFHHTPIYESWDEFVNDDNALNCNCIAGNPLLYWYWDCDNDADEWPLTKENFKRIILIYRSWFIDMKKIIIKVTWQDESKIRKFIYDQQLNQTVKFSEDDV